MKFLKVFLLSSFFLFSQSQLSFSWIDPYNTYDGTYPRFRRSDVESEYSSVYVGASIIVPFYNKLDGYQDSFHYSNNSLISANNQSGMDMTKNAGFSLFIGKYYIGSRFRFDFEFAYLSSLTNKLSGITSLYDYDANKSTTSTTTITDSTYVSLRNYNILFNMYFHSGSFGRYSFFINPAIGFSFADLELGTSTSNISTSLISQSSSNLSKTYDTSSTLVMPAYALGVGFIYSVNSALSIQCRARYIGTLSPIGTLDSTSIKSLTESEKNISSGMINLALFDLTLYFK